MGVSANPIEGVFDLIQTGYKIYTYAKFAQTVAKNAIDIKSELDAIDTGSMKLETIRRQMAQYQAELEEQARIMEERKAFLEAEGRDTNSVAYLAAKADYDNARDKYFSTEAQLAKLRNQEATLLAQRSYNEQRNNYVQPVAGLQQTYAGYSMLQGAKTVDYGEMVTANKNFAARNSLLYTAQQVTEKYIAGMQEINDNENKFGVTIENQVKKIELYNRRLKELDKDKTDLQGFKKTLQEDFDSKILEHPDLMRTIGYDVSAADEVKAKMIAVNQETINSVKALSNISGLMTEIDGKMKNLNSEERGVQQSLQAMYVSQKQEDEYRLSLQAIEDKFYIDSLKNGRPKNYDEEQKSYQAQINHLNELAAKREIQIGIWKGELDKYKENNNLTAYQQTEALLNNEIKLREENLAKVKEIEDQKNSQILNGLSDLAINVLIKGTSLKEVWSNLWKDLAREGIQRLFGVDAKPLLLSMIFGLFGAKKAHNGEDIRVSAPRMHSGGDVMAGRIGVVPALKDDEVLRTLQVGEEVNSIRDRRSNEILAAVAMRAMDNTAKAPTQVVITALDSRSFAEYLNENSDILQAVLAKNNAMGRRA